MELFIDTADLGEIAEAKEHLQLAGVTTNPTIIRKASPKDFFGHMSKIRFIIGKECSLHIQVTASSSAEQLAEANRIFQELDDEVYIKVPVDWEGLKTIKELKKKGKHVTATAIYDSMQAVEAIEAGADYVAVYVNRIGNNGGNPYQVIQDIKTVETGKNYKILGASFHSTQQLRETMVAGADAVTAPLSIIQATYGSANIIKAVNDFRNDFFTVYGEGKSLLNVDHK